MRYGLLASMLVGLLMAPSAAAQGRSHTRHIKDWFIQKPPAFQEQSWTVHGDSWKASVEEAIDDALEKAQGKVVAFLHEQTPPLTWIPPVSFIKRELVKDMPEEREEILEDQKRKMCEIDVNHHRAYEEKRRLNDPNVPEAHQVWLRVSITPEAWGKILEEQRNDLLRLRTSVMKERMLFLLKVMVGMVALLATVAGYIRLDEWSKGYYTNWLRLAAMSCMAAAGWWLLLAFK